MAPRARAGLNGSKGARGAEWLQGRARGSARPRLQRDRKPSPSLSASLSKMRSVRGGAWLRARAARPGRRGSRPEPVSEVPRLHLARPAPERLQLCAVHEAAHEAAALGRAFACRAAQCAAAPGSCRAGRDGCRCSGASGFSSGGSGDAAPPVRAWHCPPAPSSAPVDAAAAADTAPHAQKWTTASLRSAPAAPCSAGRQHSALTACGSSRGLLPRTASTSSARRRRVPGGTSAADRVTCVVPAALATCTPNASAA
jgi:hypothetical protein